MSAADLRALAGASKLAYVAVDTPRGPHVTPVLFAAAAQRTWFVVNRGTLKARILARRPEVGVLVDRGERALVIAGRAAVLDPIRGRQLSRDWSELLRAPLALAPFTWQNAHELAGTARDTLRFPGQLRPDTHVLISVVPRTVTPVIPPPEHDAFPQSGNSPVDLGPFEIPPRLAARAERPGRAVLGWPRRAGPLALPARWDPAARRVRVAWPVAAPPEGVERAVSLCFDASRGPGPSAKTGLLLRGRGRVTARREVDLVLERATYWDGFQTTTVDVAGRVLAATTA